MLQIKGWARHGWTDEQIAKNGIGISRAAFYQWLKKYESIKNAIEEGRRPETVDIEDALFNSAKGYKVTIKKPIKIREEKQKQGEGRIIKEHIEYVEEEVYIPPQVSAQIFWLKNRSPENWRDKPKEIENNTDDPLNELFRRLDDESAIDS